MVWIIISHGENMLKQNVYFVELNYTLTVDNYSWRKNKRGWLISEGHDNDELKSRFIPNIKQKFDIRTHVDIEISIGCSIYTLNCGGDGWYDSRPIPGPAWRFKDPNTKKIETVNTFIW